MEALVRLLDMKDDKLYPGGAARWRRILDPSFADEVLYDSRSPQWHRISWMFSKKNLKFNLEECKNFMVLLIVD